MRKKDKIGFAIAGLGNLSEFNIIPAFQQTNFCKLVGLISGDSQKLAVWAKRYNISSANTYLYDDFNNIAQNPEIDAVYIALPNFMHAEFTIRAARAGKHVLCEKPMANSADDCERMISVCKKYNQRLAIAYRARFEPHHLEMIRLAREKVFGQVKIIEANFSFYLKDDPSQWRLKRDLAGGGALMDVGIYALQAARYITGEEPIVVSAQAFGKYEVEETIFFQLQFPGGAIANCGASYLGHINRLHVAAEKGWFKLEPAFTYSHIQGWTGNGKLILPQINQFAVEMDNFSKCILDNKPIITSGEDGLRDIEIIQNIYSKLE